MVLRGGAISYERVTPVHHTESSPAQRHFSPRLHSHLTLTPPPSAERLRTEAAGDNGRVSAAKEHGRRPRCPGVQHLLKMLCLPTHPSRDGWALLGVEMPGSGQMVRVAPAGEHRPCPTSLSRKPATSKKINTDAPRLSRTELQGYLAHKKMPPPRILQ